MCSTRIERCYARCSPSTVACRQPSGGSVACTLLIGGERRSASREAVVDDRHVLRSEGLFFLLIHEQWLEELLGTGLTTNEAPRIARLLAASRMRSRRRSRERLTCRLTPSIGAGAPGARCPFRPPDDVPIQGRREGGNKEREQHGSPSTEESACYWCPSVGESGISNPSSMNSSATEQETRVLFRHSLLSPRAAELVRSWLV